MMEAKKTASNPSKIKARRNRTRKKTTTLLIKAKAKLSKVIIVRRLIPPEKRNKRVVKAPLKIMKLKIKVKVVPKKTSKRRRMTTHLIAKSKGLPAAKRTTRVEKRRTRCRKVSITKLLYGPVFNV